MAVSFKSFVVLLMTALYARYSQAIAAKDSLEEDMAFELQLGEQPWLALLEIPGRAFCSGTIVSPTSILTAALCLKGVANPTHGTVYAGNVEYREPKDFDPPTQNRTIVKYFLYDEKNILIYNLMLVKINHKWVWSTTVQPIGIIEEESLPEYFQSPCYVSGLGAGSGTEDDRKVARAASVWMGTWNSCAHLPQDQHMCFNDSQMLLTRTGDLGGPVLCELELQNKLYSIISEQGQFGPEEIVNQSQIPANCSGFQFIGLYAPWIKKTGGDLMKDHEIKKIRQEHQDELPHPLGANGLFMIKGRKRREKTPEELAAEAAAAAAAAAFSTEDPAASCAAAMRAGLALVPVLLAVLKAF